MNELPQDHSQATTDEVIAPKVRNGAELVAYWEREGLIGTRSDITDSARHAREIREKAECC